jgi:hypothetical protein
MLDVIPFSKLKTLRLIQLVAGGVVSQLFTTLTVTAIQFYLIVWDGLGLFIHAGQNTGKRKSIEATAYRVYMVRMEEPIVLRKSEEIVLHQLKKLVFKGAIQSIQSTGIMATEGNVATQMGISVEQLRLEYGNLYSKSQ